jgi:hypothetical protein
VITDELFGLLVEDHDAISEVLLDPDANDRRCRGLPPVSSGAILLLATPARLTAYLESRGWVRDPHTAHTWTRLPECSDEPDTCIVHAAPVAFAEIMAWDVESVAVGEGVSVLRVLAGLVKVFEREGGTRW